ncbi:hypothetical protein KKI91_18555, partial [Xenorhabdus bovienii]|uniref:hypothetical protein n=1 Tax=Xenorhabdus bovienii TaxID=40576 RepID=UPI0023B24EA8
AIKQGTRAASLETQPYQHLIVNTVQMSRLRLTRRLSGLSADDGMQNKKLFCIPSSSTANILFKH